MRWPWQREVEEGELVRSAASERDERISAYLDGLLPAPDRAGVERDAASEADVRVALEGMRAVRAGLGGLGLKRAPRTFTLEPGLVQRSYGLPRFELYARVGAVAAALALSVTALAPQFTAGVVSQEAASTSVESPQPSRALQDAASGEASKAADTQKQTESPTGARAAVPAAPVTESAAPAAAPAGAPATGGAAGAAAPQAPAAVAPQSAPAPAPRSPEAFGANSGAPPSAASPPSTRAPGRATDAAQAPTALPPVELSRLDRAGALTWVQLGLAIVAVSLAMAALVLMIRRRTSFR